LVILKLSPSGRNNFHVLDSLKVFCARSSLKFNLHIVFADAEVLESGDYGAETALK